jgi:hypothetical protein
MNKLLSWWPIDYDDECVFGLLANIAEENRGFGRMGFGIDARNQVPIFKKPRLRHSCMEYDECIDTSFTKIGSIATI